MDSGPHRRSTGVTVKQIPSARWEGGKDHHHWDQVVEYIYPDQVPDELARIAANPAARPSQQRGRRRDADRSDGKVKNPAYQDSSPCIVCKFHHKRARPRRTSWYCRECHIEPNWPFITRCTGYKRQYYPKICSRACWDIFHTTRIPLLDNPTCHVKRSRNAPPSE